MDHFVEVATDESTGMLAQTEQVFSQEEEVLASVNSEKSRLVSVTIYVTDFANLGIFNEAWKRWLPEGCVASRAC
jgi:enamine deaminase RidA (YjgF/YER057c/UK114 family)